MNNQYLKEALAMVDALTDEEVAELRSALDTELASGCGEGPHVLPQSNQTCRSTNASPQGDEPEAHADFEAWWEAHGQFSRAGGGEYEKTFAYNAWKAARAGQQGEDLPSLPEPEDTCNGLWAYTADQMREYGAACRASTGIGCKRMESDENGGEDCRASAGAADALDAARLDFMAQHEAWIAFGKDGESCRVFHRNEDGDAVPMLGWGARHWRHDVREAIDAARNTQPGGAPDA